MPRFNYVGGQKAIKQESGSTPASYTAHTRFAIAHTLTNSVGAPMTPDVFLAVEAQADPNERQTVTITGTPTGGTFTLTLGDQTTDDIAYNAAASAVETALEALSNVGSGNVSCTGGALPGTAVVCDFSGGDLAGTFMDLMTADDSDLTGGTTPAVAVTGASVTDHQVRAIGADSSNVYCTASGDVGKIWIYTG